MARPDLNHPVVFGPLLVNHNQAALAKMLGGGMVLGHMAPYQVLVGPPIVVDVFERWNSNLELLIEGVDGDDREPIWWTALGDSAWVQLSHEERQALFASEWDPPPGREVGPWPTYPRPRPWQLVARMRLADGESAPTEGYLDLFLMVVTVARVL